MSDEQSQRSWPGRMLQFLGSSCVLTLSAALTGSLFACLSAGQFRAIPIAAVFLWLFLVIHLWPVLLVFGIWLTWFPPRRLAGWLVLFLFAFAAGLVTSWRFQIVLPWDMSHEADGSMPGWQPVRMASLTSIIACLSSLASVVLTALFARRFHRFDHDA